MVLKRGTVQQQFDTEDLWEPSKDQLLRILSYKKYELSPRFRLETRNETTVVSGFGVKENAIPLMKPARVKITRYPAVKMSKHFLACKVG